MTRIDLLLVICLASASVASLPNVGTTLFGESDLEKSCWDGESMTLLRARYFLEVLMPCRGFPLDDAYVRDVLLYFHLILDSIQALPDARKKQLYLNAMRDVIGGYVHAHLLPLTRFSYYAGFVNYRSVKKIIGFFNNLKELLRTEGQGWSAPRHLDWKGIEARKLPLKMSAAVCQMDRSPCRNLQLYRKVQVGMVQASPTGCAMMQDFQIPVPFFDCRAKPHAVALPFVNCPLIDVKSERSAYVLVRYYVRGLRCLYCASKATASFRDNLYTWLVDEIAPRLGDDVTYVAFGGVLRVVATLKDQGAARANLLERRQGYNRDAGVSLDPFTEVIRRKLNWILNALLIVLALWFLVACLVMCCRLQRKRCSCIFPKRKRKWYASSSNTSTTFVDNLLATYSDEPCATKRKNCRFRRKPWSSESSKAYFTLTEESAAKPTSEESAAIARTESTDSNELSPIAEMSEMSDSLLKSKHFKEKNTESPMKRSSGEMNDSSACYSEESYTVQSSERNDISSDSIERSGTRR